jgi:hypothetical protein
MKQRSFKLQPDRGGWIRTTLAPINERTKNVFGAKDLAMFLAVVALVVVVARVCLAH